MSAVASRGGEQVRSAELVAALCLATDLGMGFPFEHGLHSTLIAKRLADRLGVDRETRCQTYYACLLSRSGCTTDAHVTPEVYIGPSCTRSCGRRRMTSPSAPDWPWSASHRATASPQSSSGDGTSGEYDLVVGAQRLLGTSEIFLIHRTGCGMLTFKDDDVRSQLQQETVLQSAVAGRADCVLRRDGGRRATAVGL